MNPGVRAPGLLWLLWRRFSLRHWSQAPGASLALVLILALGVAVFFSIRLANRSALAGFAQFSATLTGEADLVITSDSGRLAVTTLAAIRTHLGTRPAFLVPVVEATATLPGSGQSADDFDARQIDLVGVDLFAIQNLRYARGGASRPASRLGAPRPSGAADDPGTRAPGENRGIYLGQATAARFDVAAGDSLPLVIGDNLHAVRVETVLADDPGQVSLPENLLVMDLPALQALTGTAGWLDRIEIFLPDGPTPARALAETEQAVRAIAGVDWQIQSAAERQAAARRMTAAFRANLTVLSALALLVGWYLIIQALEAAVVRRRPEIATLLSLGVAAKTIRTAWLVEATVLGVIGSGLGLLLGYAGAQLAVRGVAQTVNALYLSTQASQASWHSGEAGVAFTLGVLASLVAGILPARDAASTAPAHVLRLGTASPGIKLLDRPWQGVLMLVLGGCLLPVPPLLLAGKVRFPLAGYAIAILWLVGTSVVFSSLLPITARLLHRRGTGSPTWRVALGQLRRPTGRHKLTVAGLVVAVSMAAGMGILIHSFETTMQRWVGQTLKADLFVACKGIQNASNRNRISARTWQTLASDPAVAAVDVGHIHLIRFEDAPTMLVGARLGRGWTETAFTWLAHRDQDPGLDRADPDGRWPAYVSESFSRRYDKRVGAAIELPTPTGPQPLRIAGIFADYGNERGSLLVDPDRVTAWYADDSAVNLAAYLVPGTDRQAMRQAWARQYPGLVIRDNATLRAEVWRIFRQTFSITYALKFIGVAVAVAGLVLALVSLLLERRRELTTLREVGMSNAQVRTTVMIEGSLVAVTGLVGGLVLSLALGYLLIFVINRQSFGWTLGFAWPLTSTLVLAATVLLASVLSAAVVGQWSARLRGEQEE